VGACAGTFIITWGWNSHLSILLCLLIGIAIGAWQGFWIAYARIPAFIVTLSGMLVFRGLTLIVLGGLTLAPFPEDFLAYSTGYIPDLFPTLNLFGLRNSTSFLVGVLLAIIYCITQVRGWITRKKKAYEVESPWILALKVVIVSAAVIWLFYTLGAYRGVPKV